MLKIFVCSIVFLLEDIGIASRDWKESDQLYQLLPELQSV